MAGGNKSIISDLADRLSKFAGGFQAQPAAVLNENKKPIRGLTTLGLPTMHRFLNVIGMAAGFIGLKYIADIMYGHKINGSHYEEIPREKVFILLRPLHGIIKSNPYSDRTKDRVLTIVHKLMPGIGGALGAIGGSAYFFVQNGTTENMAALGKMKGLSAGDITVRNAAQSAYKQGLIWRIWAGATAWLSSVSGVTGLFYGTGLNQSFWSVNSAKTMATNLIKKVPNIKITDTTGRSKIAIIELASVAAIIGSAIGFGAKDRAKKAKKDAAGLEKDLDGLAAKEYVAAVEKKTALEKKKGLISGPVLNAVATISDMALAVVPVHRFWSAFGLLAGGTAGMFASRGMQKMVTDKFQLQGNNKYLKLAGDYLFAAACAVGVVIGSNHAYRSADRRNEADTDSLEGVLARTRAYQGKSITPVVALTAIPGSALGTYLVPPVSYGNPLMAKTLAMQDRHVITPGLKWMTGATGNHYFGLREGLDYTIKYAVRNPDEKPEQLEALTLTVLGPVAHAAGTELKGENVRKFTDQLNTIRAKYWEQGGVPGDRQEALTKELKEHFTGKGLDKTLLKSDIDILKMDLKKVGGGFGWFAGYVLGANKKIEREQKRFEEMVTGWRNEQEAGVKESTIESTIKPGEEKIYSENKKVLVEQHGVQAEENRKNTAKTEPGDGRMQPEHKEKLAEFHRRETEENKKDIAATPQEDGKMTAAHRERLAKLYEMQAEEKKQEEVVAFRGDTTLQHGGNKTVLPGSHLAFSEELQTPVPV